MAEWKRKDKEGRKSGRNGRVRRGGNRECRKIVQNATYMALWAVTTQSHTLLER